MRWLRPAYLKRRFGIEVERTLRFAARTGLWRGPNEAALLSLRDKYKGKPGFVIGNGPSLTANDLDRIHRGGFASIASNKIFLAFDNTAWRPDILTVADKLVAEQVAETYDKIDLPKVVPRAHRALFRRATAGRTILFNAIPARKLEPEHYRPRFSHDPLGGLFIGQTVTVLNIQLAAWLGCDPIILIGLDGKYAVDPARARDKDYGDVAVTGGETNHFHKDYRKPGDLWSIPRPDLHEKEYEHCVRELTARGRTLINASRASVVRAFERRDLDAVFEAIERAMLDPRGGGRSDEIQADQSAPSRGEPSVAP